ncbi:leucine rich repeat-containing protein [Chaetoceros tenuissimus]|uniref:Leucine rich repeat-containing protein n=1 Tax=Chaetoceros tenuissimus TaxID=426638 RepID=A0AAD3D036_9STRA|nr:leucine rich repeat-containing protein [Chaetoceros tenuissimus]
MRVQTEEWRQFVPGIRMYKGKKTLFYNGEKLWEEDDEDGHPLVYNEEERNTWQVIIVLPGVEIIPYGNFSACKNIEAVIMADDSVRKVDWYAFKDCKRLSYVRLSSNLEFIGDYSFKNCHSLTSIFIPPSCKWIGYWAFNSCSKLIIFVVPQHTQLGEEVLADTALIRRNYFYGYVYDGGLYHDSNEIDDLIKNINGDTEEYALHRACSSYYPITEIIHGIVKRQGLKALKKKNEIGITPLQYLEENPFAEISQSALMKQYVLEMMGEVV